MQHQEIEIIEGTKSFENDSMVATMSNIQKNGTMKGSYVIIPKSGVGSPFERTEKLFR